MKQRESDESKASPILRCSCEYSAYRNPVCIRLTWQEIASFSIQESTARKKFYNAQSRKKKRSAGTSILMNPVTTIKSAHKKDQVCTKSNVCRASKSHGVFQRGKNLVARTLELRVCRVVL